MKLTNKNNQGEAPVHRFTSPNNIHFRLVTITHESFAVPDVEHRHSYWTVFVFLKGKGKHLIDFETIATQPGSVHIVLPGQIHALHGEKGFMAYGLVFTEDFFLMRDETTRLLMRLFAFMDAGKPVVFDLEPAELPVFTSLLQLMEHEYKSPPAENKADVLLNLLSVFISKCSGALKLPGLPAGADDSLSYIRLRNAVENNYRQMHTVADYATLLNCTPKQLNDLCRKYTGSTVLEFIHARLVIEARRLLLFADKPVKEIAYELHFTDTAHFTNFFKQKTGTTPVEFKSKGR